jgi:hypothetical protein
MRADTIAATAIEHYTDAVAHFEHLLGRLMDDETQRLTHGEVEALVHTEGDELLRRLTQGYLDQRSAEERVQERVVGEDGRSRTHRREGCKRHLESRFGEVGVTRRGYGGRGLESVFPLDAALNLPPNKGSHGLREVLVEELIPGSFDEAVAHLARAGGGQMAKRQAEEVAVQLSQDFDAFDAQPLAPQPEAGGAEPMAGDQCRWQGHCDVDKAGDYLESSRQRLRYDQALAQGLPIATGVIEGACRHLVKNRMDITGARWGLERAEAILKLRSLKVSGDLPAYLTFHFEQERKRRYPGPPLPQLQRPAA